MSDNLLSRCLKKGIRMTSQRQVIVGVIGDAEDHPDVDELYRRAVKQDNTISIATVYRTVKLLEELAKLSFANDLKINKRIESKKEGGPAGASKLQS